MPLQEPARVLALLEKIPLQAANSAELLPCTNKTDASEATHTERTQDQLPYPSGLFDCHRQPSMHICSMERSAFQPNNR